MTAEQTPKNKCCRKYKKKNEYCKRCPVALKTACIEKTKKKEKLERKKNKKKKNKKKKN